MTRYNSFCLPSVDRVISASSRRLLSFFVRSRSSPADVRSVFRSAESVRKKKNTSFRVSVSRFANANSAAMNPIACLAVTFVLIAVAETLLAAVLSNAAHPADSQEVEENLIVSRRRAAAEHDHRTDPEYAGIFGDEENSEEFKNLDPLEQKKRLRTVIDVMDRNNNGFIEKNELADRLLESYKKLSAEESDSDFESTDFDEDGFVTWKEYIGDTYSTSQEDLYDDVTKEEKDLFDAADVDKDGKLSKTEFRSFYTPEDYEHMQSVLINGIMDRFDTNHDGIITFEEFTGDRKSDHDSKWLEEEKYKFENELDINKNGVLEVNEMLGWASTSNAMIAESEAESLVLRTDKNGDGMLSYDEMLSNYSVFTSPDSEGYYIFKDEL